MNISSRAALAIFIITAAACGGGGGSGYSNGSPTGPTQPTCPSTPGTVCLVSSNQFSPTSITILAGSAVAFDNISNTTHNVTFTTSGAPADVSDFSSGTQSVVFPTAGTYNYHCTIHGLSMSGVVVVQ
jgi:plastocyanin